MLDFSFAEIALIVVVAVIFIGPKQLPALVKAVSKGMRSVRSLGNEVRKAFDELAEESGVKDIERDIKMIQGDDGKFYETYDIKKVSSPVRGED